MSKPQTTDPKPCACGCGRPRDRAGQRYRRDCATQYMRYYRARKKRAGLDGLAQRVAELDAVAAAELDMAELAALAVNAAKLHRRITVLQDRLAGHARRYFEAQE